MLPGEYQYLVIIVSFVIYFHIDEIKMISEGDNRHEVKKNVITIDNNHSVDLLQTLETVTSLLSSKNLMLSSMKYTLSPRERVRLIRMVQKVVQLANEVLDLNYTTTTTARQSQLTATSRIFESKIINISHEQKNLAEIIPTNLFVPCDQREPNLIDNFHYNKVELNKNSHDLNVLEDYELPEFDTESESISLVKKSRRFIGRKVKIGFDLLQEMIERANHLKGIVTDMIRKNLMKNCLKLDVPHIFQIPSPPHNNISFTLAGIYQSLANQTAHLYFIWTEQKRYINQQKNNDCMSHRRDIELSVPILSQHDRSKLYTQEGLNWISRVNKKTQLRLIAQDFLVVSNNLRSLMCYLNQAIHLFDIQVPTEQIVRQVLSHRINFNVSCARQSIFECQLMRDAVRFFSDIEDFLRQESYRFLTSSNNNI